jgi:pantetheine-phosphate adenylyltransferase
MKIAVYPGSFNPWHKGHEDILAKALLVFDKVVIAQGINPDKNFHDVNIPSKLYGTHGPRIQLAKFRGLLADFIKNESGFEFVAVIRGLRNGQDFEFERTQQYWNEDLGLQIPTVYFIADRELTHISSSAIRAVEVFKK